MNAELVQPAIEKLLDQAHDVFCSVFGASISPYRMDAEAKKVYRYHLVRMTFEEVANKGLCWHVEVPNPREIEGELHAYGRTLGYALEKLLHLIGEVEDGEDD